MRPPRKCLPEAPGRPREGPRSDLGCSRTPSRARIKKRKNPQVWAGSGGGLPEPSVWEPRGTEQTKIRPKTRAIFIMTRRPLAWEPRKTEQNKNRSQTRRNQNSVKNQRQHMVRGSHSGGEFVAQGFVSTSVPPRPIYHLIYQASAGEVPSIWVVQRRVDNLFLSILRERCKQARRNTGRDRERWRESDLAFSQGLKMPRDLHARAARAAERVAQRILDRALEKAAERIRQINSARALRIKRIQDLYYPELLIHWPVKALPIPPLCYWSLSRREWESDYRTWRDAVLLMLRARRDHTDSD